jgi:hypothetical protein
VSSIFGRAAFAALALSTAHVAYAQEVSSTIRGTVTSTAGTPVSNATVTLVHQPSGTRSVQTTDDMGTFNAQGLRVGGPFTATIEAPGFQRQVINDIFTTVGEAYGLAARLTTEAEDKVIVVSGRRIGGGLQTGQQTRLNSDAIAGIASTTRDVRDLIRRDPLASTDPNPRGRAVSIAGANPRTNRFSIDGVTVGDNFGLNSGGLPSARGIVSLEAIDQLTVKAAPADISEGDMQGGSVNIVMKSGGNRFHGSVFGIYGDDSLSGTRAYDNVRVNGDEVAPSSSKLIVSPRFRDYGAFLSGPILKDRLFFALAYERLTEGQVNPRGLSGEGAATTIPFITRAGVDEVRDILQTRYRFDPLDVPTVLDEKDKKISAKVDWNVTDGHRLAATYIHHENAVPREVGNSESTSNPSVGLQSNWYLLGEKTDAYTGQYNAQWTKNFSTELRFTHRDYERRQDPYAGLAFPEFEVCLDRVAVGSATSCTVTAGNPSGRVLLGPDQFRQSNYLAVTNNNLSLNSQLRLGTHAVKVLTEFSKVKINNLFVPATLGRFYFDSVADLRAGRASQLTYANALTGSPDDAAAQFDYSKITLGLQDSWQVNPDVTLLYGLRYDRLDVGRPVLNQRFATAYGFSNQSMPEDGVFQPRVGLNWRASPNLRVSASAGLFAGGTPDVWLSNSFSNDGTRQNSLLFQRTATGFVDATQVGAARNIDPLLGSAALDNITSGAIPSVVQQYLAGRGAPAAASVGALDPDIKLVSTWKLNLAADWAGNLAPGWLGEDWSFQASTLFTRAENALIATDLRTRAIGVLPDGRPRYDATVGSNSDILLRNTSNGRGIALALGLGKRFGGFDVGLNYVYQDIKDVGSFTGFTPTELYGVATVDPDRAPYGRSTFETRHNGKLRIGYRTDLFGDNEFRIDLFGEARSGKPFSYTFTDTAAGRSTVFGTVGGGGRYLVFVPDFNQAAVVSSAGRPQVGNVEFANQATLDSFRAIVDATKLRDYYGRIAPRNLGTSPAYTKVDVRVQQAFPLPLGAKFRLFADVENVLNLINRNWNTYKVFNDTVSVTNVSCVAQGTNSCARYLYSNPNNQVATTFQNASLWQVRIGARIDF